MKKMNKKAQMWDWLVHALFYLGLIFLLAVIVLLLSGKLDSVWHGLLEKMRFA